MIFTCGQSSVKCRSGEIISHNFPLSPMKVSEKVPYYSVALAAYPGSIIGTIFYFLIISRIGVAWIICLCNFQHITCWSHNVDERHTITSVYTTQVLDHFLIGLRYIPQVDYWSFGVCFLSQIQLFLFLRGTSVWCGDVTVVHLSTCAVLVYNE